MSLSSVSAIVPTYNRSGMLRECLDSVLGQTRAPQEVIVVNDGSTDDTESIVRSYGDRINLINKENAGKAAALNTALALCRSDFVWVCDDDDIAAPNGLGNLIEPLDADESIGFTYGTFRIFEDIGRTRTYSEPAYWAREEEPNVLINFLEGMFTFQYAMLVRRSLYAETGPFREDLIRSQDYDMAIRLARRAKAHFVPEVIFYQRKHQGTRGSAADSFCPDESMKKWLNYDRKIFSEVRNAFRLEEFTPTFALAWDQSASRRAALIQRACVLAKRGIWSDAIQDFHEACSLSSPPLTLEERRLAESVIRDFLPWGLLDREPAHIAELRACAKENHNSRDLICAFCRPLVWLARKALQSGHQLDGIRMLRLLFRILGPGGTIRRIAESVRA
jgi:GT2 family glycosyltransferase